MRTRRWIVLLTLLVVVFGGLAAVQGAGILARPTAVAAVDVETVLNALEEKSAIDADLKGRLDHLTQESKEKQLEISAMEKDLDLYKVDSEGYKEKETNLRRKAVDLKVWQEFEVSELNREKAIQAEYLYRKLIEAVGAVCSSNGYDMAIFKERAVDFRGLKPEALVTMINVRKVLWVKDDLDLTKQIIDKMNADYKHMINKK